MNDECLDISDLIITYTNNTISKEDKVTLLKHLAICSQCRKELAEFLELSQNVLNLTKEVPEDIMKNAFSLIQENCRDKSSITLLDLKSSLNSLKVIPYALSTTRKSIKLILQFI